MTIKIVFDGTPSSGKTTTLNTIQQFFVAHNALMNMVHMKPIKVGYVKEAAWDLFEAQPNINRGALSTQKQLMDMMIQREQATIYHADGNCLSINDVMFIDRGIYGCKLFCAEDTTSIAYIIDQHSLTYDKIYLFHPDNAPLVNNEVRIETADQRQQLHVRFKNYLTIYNLPYEELLGENLERTGRIIQFVFERLGRI